MTYNAFDVALRIGDMLEETKHLRKRTFPGHMDFDDSIRITETSSTYSPGQFTIKLANAQKFEISVKEVQE